MANVLNNIRRARGNGALTIMSCGNIHIIVPLGRVLIGLRGGLGNARCSRVVHHRGGLLDGVLNYRVSFVMGNIRSGAHAMITDHGRTVLQGHRAFCVGASTTNGCHVFRKQGMRTHIVTITRGTVHVRTFNIRYSVVTQSLS